MRLCQQVGSNYPFTSPLQRPCPLSQECETSSWAEASETWTGSLRSRPEEVAFKDVIALGCALVGAGLLEGGLKSFWQQRLLLSASFCITTAGLGGSESCQPSCVRSAQEQQRRRQLIHLWGACTTWLEFYWVMLVFLKWASYIWPLETAPSLCECHAFYWQTKNVTPSPNDSLHSLCSLWALCTRLLFLHTFLHSYLKILHNIPKAAYYITLCRE